MELTSYTAEGRNRKRFQSTQSENEDPARRSGMALPFGRGSAPSNDAKPINHARRRSTVRESNKAPLLGPRPLENSKRYGPHPNIIPTSSIVLTRWVPLAVSSAILTIKPHLQA